MDRISSIKDFHPYAADYKYVSFDIFDTILKRRFLRANEVHDTVSAYARTLIGGRTTHVPANITTSRFAAGSALKAQPGVELQEPTVAMVWDWLLSFEQGLSNQEHRSKLVNRIVDFEYALEFRNLGVIDGALELLQRLKAEGKVLIAISDMYFGSDVIEGFLEKLGLREYFDHVYVSAELNLTKQTGDLFKHVLDDLKLAPHQMRHVGDNEHSDVAMATKVGIACVLCEQEHLLELERPDYGKRERIEEDVADIVKAHLFSVLLDVHERQASHIYFMGRDGCTISEFLTRWQSHLVQTYLAPPTYSDLFLNRVLTSWANVDFTSSNWLEQAVGIAFWLKEGKASGNDLAALLGVSIAPAALGAQQLVAAQHTYQAVKAFREAGLEPEIKASIMAKCGDVERYLDGVGFFEHKAVAISDIGYSGSVLRALNRLLLHRPAEACAQRVPPAAMLHLIATYSNYEVNRAHALPTVQFSNHPVLPIERLPNSLRETFAWIEYFFKHPTLRPVLKLIDVDGQLEPLLIEDDEPTELIPSQRLQYFAVDQDADIALLWMAAMNDFSPLTDGILDRFANPDRATIAQMRDEIFELDPIEGTRRSIILEVEGARPDVVAQLAIAGDYWVAGSVAATVLSVERGLDSKESNAGTKRRGILDVFKRPSAAIENLLNNAWGFNAEFYRSYYPDLRQFADVELLQHYTNHGRKEGRLCSSASLRAQLQTEFGYLPEGFSAAAYLHYNPDLAATADSAERALDHYMRIGRHEGRIFRPQLELLINEFEELRCRNRLGMSKEEEKRVVAGETTLSVFLHRHRLEPGPWVDLIDVAEFRAMHSSWCGSVVTRAECIVALCDLGLDRAPCLSLRHRFDPDYYRKRIGESETATTEDLYRHYLNAGQGLAASEEAELLRVWGNGEFPSCFDWIGYSADVGTKLSGLDRVEVLDAFEKDFETDRLSFVSRDDSAQFVEWLALRSWHNHRRLDEARRLLVAALDRGGSSGSLYHWLGDLESDAGRIGLAIEHYRASTEAASPQRWSYLCAGSLLLDRGDYKSALAILEKGRGIWQEGVLWRVNYDRAMQAWAKSCISQTSLGSGSFDEPDRLVLKIGSRISAPTLFTAPKDGVVVITGRPHATELGKHLLPADITVLGLDAIRGSEFLAPMLRNGTVIFHEVPFTYEVLQACLTARSLGRRTVCWLGDLINWNGWSLKDCVWDESGRNLSVLQSGNLPELGLVARYCDVAITSIAGCANALKKIAPAARLELVDYRHEGLRRVPDGNRIALVLLDAKASSSEVERFASELLRSVQADPRLHLIISANLASAQPFHQMVGRWSALEELCSLPDIADLIATSDLVVQCVDRDAPPAFAAWQCAAAVGVPAIVVPLDGRTGKRNAAQGTESPWNHDVALTEEGLSHAIISSLDGNLLPVSNQEKNIPRLEASPAGSGSGKKKMILVNSWAPPQVIGGATRVMRDNIDYVLDHHGDEFEIVVFAADDYREGSANFSVDTYRGVPVFRLGLPPEGNIFWQPFSALAASHFASILESFQPDLVHIHCLQRLTASIAESCQARGIPYFVTLHDAWWLSDFPFLVNEHGLSAPAHLDYHRQQRNVQFGISASTLRAESVRRTLLGARRRLAVSKSFAQLYATCGIPCDVIENGTSKIRVSPRALSAGPVQICHLGGLERHKGAFLVEAALRDNMFANIELTMVDLTRDGSSTSHTVWGGTRVHIIGKMGSEELSQFYARMHVLVAPSTCEESFGLVTREALAHGLWVISGDQGAMSEPICEGVNGHTVGVSDAQDLRRIFAAINTNPEQYRVSPPAELALRHVDDQSRELVDLYRRTLDHGAKGRAASVRSDGSHAS